HTQRQPHTHTHTHNSGWTPHLFGDRLLSKNSLTLPLRACRRQVSLYKHRAVQNERLLKGFMLVLVSSGIWHFGNILMFTFLTTRIFFAIVLIVLLYQDLT